MANLTLSAVPALGGYSESFDGVSLSEVVNLAIVSMALPLGGKSAAKKAFKTTYGVALPDVGKSAMSKDGATRALRLGRDQAFVLFHHDAPDANNVVAEKMGGKVYTTDQTDAWVGLDISGSNARKALERICPVNLNPAVFAEGDIARTNMEHLGTVIIRTGDDEYRLLSASSSAGSFLHAVETSIKNIL